MLDTYKNQLFLNLQTAIELEHSTIPPYLSAFFTINQDTNPFAWQAVRSVVMEEMLHMSLACNILNAVGGQPFIDHPKFVPEYPAKLEFADRDFDVGLIKFSQESIETFMEIEKPADLKLHVHGEEIPGLLEPIKLDESTIGEFYAVIKEQLKHLCQEYGEEKIFTGPIENQLHPEDYYGAGGNLIVVENLKTALFAIDIIVEQGEGTSTSVLDGDHDYFAQDSEVAHFFRFKEVLVGQKYKPGDSPHKPPTGPKVEVNWKDVPNMIPNPKACDFPEGSPAREKADEFNQLYSYFLQLLHEAFNGNPKLVTKAVGLMYKLKYVAQELLNIKIPGKKGDFVAGPPFEFVPIEGRDKFPWLIQELTADD